MLVQAGALGDTPLVRAPEDIVPRKRHLIMLAMIEFLAGDNGLLPTPIGSIDNHHPGVIIHRQLSLTQGVGHGPQVLKAAIPVAGEGPLPIVKCALVVTTRQSTHLTILTASRWASRIPVPLNS